MAATFVEMLKMLKTARTQSLSFTLPLFSRGAAHIHFLEPEIWTDEHLFSTEKSRQQKGVPYHDPRLARWK